MLCVLLLTASLAAPISLSPVAPAPGAPTAAAQTAAVASPAPPRTPAAGPAATQNPQSSNFGLDDGTDGADAPESTGYLLFKTLVVLGVVVAFIYLTLNVGARKLLKLGPARSALVKVVDRVALDPKKSLYVLEVGGEYLLVGSSEHALNFISKLEPEQVQKVLAERVASRGASPTFLDRLGALAKSQPRKPQ